MHAAVKAFSERNPVRVGAVAIGGLVVFTLVALNYQRLPFIGADKEYSAYFAEAGGLKSGNPVQVSGVKVGNVSSVALSGARVLVTFKISQDVRLGDRTEATIKSKSILGIRYLDVRSRGGGRQTGPIPVDRTTSPYQLPDALGDLTTTISGLNTGQLSDSLSVLADTLSDTPPAVKAAVSGVARFSQTLSQRDESLRNLLSNAKKATAVLAERSNEVVALLGNANALLVQLESQSNALEEISHHLSAAAQQLKGFITENRETLKPALDKLNGVLTLVDNRKQRVQEGLKGLNSYLLSLGESLASGPFFKVYIANLLPGQFIQPFVDAAFSDLGVDPATLLPSQRSDPQIGQPGTPPLPVPYPRTGQGGDPRRTLPDAITGNPSDHPCGLPNVPLPGPGCYPAQQPPPAPPPGGPPPGPPALPPGQTSRPEPTPNPVYVPAPGEQPSHTPATVEGGR
ncbi:Mce family protein Mce3C [Mycobacterium paraintracellulare]|nr:Mce family protein Mce3C [Mycobacterium paraintracellulare]